MAATRFELVILVLVVTLCGCKKDAPERFRFESTSQSAVSKVLRKFEIALARCTQESLRGVFDVDGIMRVAAGRTRKRIRENIVGASSRLQLIDWCRRRGQTARVSALRRKQGKMACCAYVFRLLFPNNRFDYIDVYFAERLGVVVAVDALRYSTGRRVSRVARGIAKELKDAPMIAGMGFEYARLFATAGGYQSALSVLDQLPSDAVSSRETGLLRLRLLSRVDDKRYQQALKWFRDHHPLSFGSELYEMEYAHETKRYKDSAVAATRMLESTWLNDHLLEFKRARAYVAMNNRDAAIGSIQSALASDVRHEFVSPELAAWLKKHCSAIKGHPCWPNWRMLIR